MARKTIISKPLPSSPSDGSPYPAHLHRIAGGLHGLLVGDALGVPYEFNPPDRLPPRDAIEMSPPAGFRRSHARVRPGAWSDDGAQALALLSSLLECDRLDLDDFGRRLLAWRERGAFAVDGDVFDIGAQTDDALDALAAGAEAAASGPRGERDNGNGSLMRVLPLALWHRGDDDALVRDARAQSLVTHGHPRAQVCCALYCLWARRLIAGRADAWADAVATLRAIIADDAAATHELEHHVRPDDPPRGTGSGYVVDALHSARMVFDAGSYEDVVRSAVALGEDTDTTACIAGGVAGIRDGVAAIPERWMNLMRGVEMVEPLLERLIAHAMRR